MKSEILLFYKTKLFWIVFCCILVYFPIVAFLSTRNIEKPKNISNYIGVYKNDIQLNTIQRQAEGNYSSSEDEDEKKYYKSIVSVCENISNDYMEMNEIMCSDQLVMNDSTDFFSFLFSLNDIGYKVVFVITSILSLAFVTYSFNNKKYRFLFRGHSSRAAFIKSKFTAYCVCSLGCASVILVGNVIMAYAFSPEVKNILMRINEDYIRLSRLSYVAINILFFLIAYIPVMIIMFLIALIIKNDVLTMILLIIIYPSIPYFLGKNNIYAGRFFGANALIRLGYGDAYLKELILYIIGIVLIVSFISFVSIWKFKKEEL